MHGIPRKPPTQEEQDQSYLKAAKLRHLQSQLLHFHNNKIYTTEAIEVSTKLLESNPEHYTGWNYRKLAVQHLLNQQKENGVDSVQSIFDEELGLVENALKKNFKAYGAWHHRKWVLSQGHSSSDRELRLLGKFQKLDSRNFHAWNYRRFITALKKIPDEEELQYTTDMIYDNFSNYSAWHNRSMILSNLLEKKVKGYDKRENVLTEEFDFVRNALFTDPDDQSGWFYHLWLLDQTLKQEPLLLSSWPPHGSNLSLSIDSPNCLPFLPTLYFHSKERTFPLILYFSQAVEGVSSSTVNVEVSNRGVDGFVWKPLSTNKIGFSQAWLTYINYPDDSLGACHVKVTIAHVSGIVSLGGMPCSQSSCYIAFTVSVRNDLEQSEHSEVQNAHKITWNEENFRAHSTQSQDESFLYSLCKLNIAKENKSTTHKWSVETISNEIAHCRELLSSTNCKIGKLSLARLLMAHNALIPYGCPETRTEAYYDEILTLYHDLMKMDRAHICHYEDEHSLVLLKQLTSNTKSLLKLCGYYQESCLASVSPYKCLRLSGLSLSRVANMECLLWVQMLDLSHNKLRSIEGLEALQLVSCLKLSNNRLFSFTVLEPLKMLKSLEVLDISYNEIGAHPIDTRRYLCSSPLNHTAGSEWHFKKFTDEDVDLKHYWDAYLLFKDLKLVQLDIVGNAVVNERLESFLLKLMPTLKWFDGERCH